MGFNFKKTIHLGNSVNINVSKNGVGVSVGVPGARIGVGPNGIKETLSIPGTGISYTKQQRKKKK